VVAQYSQLTFVDGLGGALASMVDPQIFSQPFICSGFSGGGLFDDI
jgi:hypothetical protein